MKRKHWICKYVNAIGVAAGGVEKQFKNMKKAD